MKICIVTGSRAEYGLLKPLIEKINKDGELKLQLLVTGAHLSPEYGLTYKHIEADGFVIDAMVEMLLSSDTSEGISKSMGLGIIGYADAFNKLKPDLLIILGDRYEMLSIACTAHIYRIPIAHIHGGELTEGSYDDAIRHAITKLSVIHFTSTEVYRNRVVQLGENPDRVFNVGAIGLDNFNTLKFLSKNELEKELKLKFATYNYLVCFHPETASYNNAKEQFNELLKAIDKQKESFFIFTKTNADINGHIINQMMENYVKNNRNKSALFSSLGTLKYLSLMKHVTAVVGNSSSGIIEAPSAKTATINIGNRQKERIQAASVVNCKAKEEEISISFNKVKNFDFRNSLTHIVNPYGVGKASIQILELLKMKPLNNLKLKNFYDIK